MNPLLRFGIREIYGPEPGYPIKPTPPIELPRRAKNEWHFVIRAFENPDLDAEQAWSVRESFFMKLCGWMSENQYSLCTLVGADERLQEDHVFKLYYVFSGSVAMMLDHPLVDPAAPYIGMNGNLSESTNDEFIILEYPLLHPFNEKAYTSLRKYFPAVTPLEGEVFDLFGLIPISDLEDITSGFILHREQYPQDFHPLCSELAQIDLAQQLADSGKYSLQVGDTGSMISQENISTLEEGVIVVPVGPIHAGIIEAGHFRFLAAGEVIEDLRPKLGYKHRGIEKLFETNYFLEDGWELAEKVSGDSSFAHSLSYCRAVEAIAGARISPLTEYWRGLFLELERIYNHVGDVGALIHDIAFDAEAARIADMRELALQVNKQITGHRLLRGANRPGEVKLEFEPDLDAVRESLSILVTEFLDTAKKVMSMSACRDRYITTGVLTAAEAKFAVGLMARASGHLAHDYRWLHPEGIYTDPEVRKLLRKTYSVATGERANRRFQVTKDDLNGDAFARLCFRVAEVETSFEIIDYLLPRLVESDQVDSTPIDISALLQAKPHLEFGIGHAEGSRGDVFYWVAKGPNNTIARCKVRDPSTFNWAVFPNGVIRKPRANNIHANDLEKKLSGLSDIQNGSLSAMDKMRAIVEYVKEQLEGEASHLSIHHWENIFADFPIINKSCNLSCAGNDL